MTTAIKVEKISKLYRLGIIGRTTLVESVNCWWERRLNKQHRANTVNQGLPFGSERDSLWALKNVSFSVEEGEVMGLIGANGSGKSTLLKILSKITEPTSGKAVLRGRIASLLEVGTGFHPELTGRENIYLNGAILGMRKLETDQKLEKIIEFSGVKKYIDMPVKRYSSGMRVRLAFAVAAHLDSEILIVDEVLAVGDAEFQEKCLGAMDSLADKGRTVIFVSHDLSAVKQLCSKAIVLEGGALVFEGYSSDAIDRYLKPQTSKQRVPLKERKDREGNATFRFEDVWIENENEQRLDTVFVGEKIFFIFDYEMQGKEDLTNIALTLEIFGSRQELIARLSNEETGNRWKDLPLKGRVRCEVPRLPLNIGRYSLDLYCGRNGENADWIKKSLFFNVMNGDYYGFGNMPKVKNPPLIFMDHNWIYESPAG